MRVKVCGVTRLEDALAAVDLGADALGFNFWPKSKRYCPPRVAQSIVAKLPPLTAAVGVFVNQPQAQIERVVKSVGLQAVQLHGNESPEFCAQFEVPVIKALAVADTASLRAIKTYAVSAYLLDTPSRGYGGSGKAFDWSLLKWLDRRKLFIL
ncbi:MAG TPA: phosphoribosylanthranilate isomerase, partial [Myxococcaceae bacterium]|nr:phosphoribosylanthranilate isomerase [Myxococcaceae bacterium]